MKTEQEITDEEIKKLDEFLAGGPPTIFDVEMEEEAIRYLESLGYTIISPDYKVNSF